MSLIRYYIYIKLILTCAVYIFPFNFWNYPLILCTWSHFSSSVNIFKFCIANLFLEIIEALLSRIYSITVFLWIFNNCVICNNYQSFNVCPVSASWPLITLQKKWSFSLRISSVNVTKFEVSCRFGHIYWRNP